MMENMDATPTYTEYRAGLLKAVTNGLANSTLNDDTKKAMFIECMRTSKDLYRLVIQTNMVKKLDQMGGLPKIALTLVGCYGNAIA